MRRERHWHPSVTPSEGADSNYPIKTSRTAKKIKHEVLVICQSMGAVQRLLKIYNNKVASDARSVTSQVLFR